MALISRKKHVYPVGEGLRGYLAGHDRLRSLPVTFADLGRYLETVPYYNKRGEDTLWETVLYAPAERASIHRGLVQTYALLKVVGDVSIMEHLVTERIDVCTWGNTRPFRVRILNTLNENFDYFYIKRADASRIYGLELEHLLSPSRIEFLCDGRTVVEEHIAGIPAEDFIVDYLDDGHLNAVRLAKEFVKFNERCLVRLLGDMHAGNFVVDITPDLDDVSYRLRAIDFDQQSYEKRCHVYLPQYYKQNNPLVFLGMQTMTVETSTQYREEERTLMAVRARAEQVRLGVLLRVMAADRIAPPAHVQHLRGELAHRYESHRFDACRSMGELLRASLDLLPAV